MINTKLVNKYFKNKNYLGAYVSVTPTEKSYKVNIIVNDMYRQAFEQLVVEVITAVSQDVADILKPSYAMEFDMPREQARCQTIIEMNIAYYLNVFFEYGLEAYNDVLSKHFCFLQYCYLLENTPIINGKFYQSNGELYTGQETSPEGQFIAKFL